MTDQPPSTNVDSRTTPDDEPLLSVRNLRTRFHTDEGVVRAVDGVDFDVGRGETVCLVGESGSGKTVTVESITRLIRSPPGEIDGDVRFDGRDVTAMSETELRRLRGARIGHVFQNPGGSLNPVYTVGAQLREAIRAHRDVTRRAARTRSIELLDAVGIPAPASRVDDYPHQFSGGMKQRVAIATAIACDPDLLIADEPTTALDVTVEAAILDLFRELQSEFGTSICYVTHDLGVVAEIADRVVVMYAGEVVERATVYDLFDRPAHPYTRRLLSCLPGRDGTIGDGDDRDSGTEPEPGTGAGSGPGTEARSEPGTGAGSEPGPGGGERTGAAAVAEGRPDPLDPPEGCRFADRCPHAIAECRSGGSPPLVPVPDSGPDHVAACLFYQEEYDESALDGFRSDARHSDGSTEAVDDSPAPDDGRRSSGTDRGETR